MDDVAVVLTFDDRILVGAGVTIQSLLDAAAPTTCYEINIIHPGFTEGLKETFQSMISASRHTMRFFEISSSRFDGVPKGKGSWTEIVYYRLLTSEVLADRDRVIYSDVDVFVADDLAEVYNTDLDGLEWAGVAAERNSPETVMHQYFPENKKDKIVFSGFMVMNLALMRSNNVVARYFDLVREIGGRLKFFDLDLVNVATPNIGIVPFRYVVLEDIFEAEDVTASREYRYLKSVYSPEELEEARDNPAIIHYAGKRGKPWQRQHTLPYYRDVEKNLPKGLKSLNFRSFRKKWLSRKGYRRHKNRRR